MKLKSKRVLRIAGIRQLRIDNAADKKPKEKLLKTQEQAAEYTTKTNRLDRQEVISKKAEEYFYGAIQIT